MSQDPKARSEFEVAQEIKTLLEAVPIEKREMVLRWAREAVGLPIQTVLGHAQQLSQEPKRAPIEPSGSVALAPRQTTLPDFVSEKQPKSDVQFAVVVAYYYRFELTPASQRAAISGEDLQEATRLAGRARFKNPLVPLNNAVGLGYLDRGDERGQFRINSVGENLVAMTLSSSRDTTSPSGRRAGKARNGRRRPTTVKTPRGKKR